VPDGSDKWYSSLGPNTDCEWYSKEGRCKKFGAHNSFYDKTADEACCACGGGVRGKELKAKAGAPAQHGPAWIWCLLCLCVAHIAA